MEFEWDEEKRRRNIEKHNFDFARVRLLFSGRHHSYASKYEFEERWVTIGAIDEVFYTVIWTPRGNAKRIISARRSRDAEKRQYRAVHG